MYAQVLNTLSAEPWHQDTFVDLQAFIFPRVALKMPVGIFLCGHHFKTRRQHPSEKSPSSKPFQLIRGKNKILSACTLNSTFSSYSQLFWDVSTFIFLELAAQNFQEGEKSIRDEELHGKQRQQGDNKCDCCTVGMILIRTPLHTHARTHVCPNYCFRLWTHLAGHCTRNADHSERRLL